MANGLEETGQSRPVTEARIARGLRRLGLGTGDTVMVHSSLSSFGRVDGGAETVVRALLEVLGNRGTLVVPTFSLYLCGNEKTWDREHTPSRMGAISESVRAWPGALRSSHAAHPIAAIGAKAKLLCRRPYRTGFGSDSPFRTLVELDAFILLLGVPYSCCTIFHLLEVESGAPYRSLHPRRAEIIIDGVSDKNGIAWEYSKQPGISNDFLPFGRLLEKHGLVRSARVGRSRLRLFPAGKMHALGMKTLAADPLFLVSKNRPG